MIQICLPCQKHFKSCVTQFLLVKFTSTINWLSDKLKRTHSFLCSSNVTLNVNTKMFHACLQQYNVITWFENTKLSRFCQKIFRHSDIFLRYIDHRQMCVNYKALLYPRVKVIHSRTRTDENARSRLITHTASAAF